MNSFCLSWLHSRLKMFLFECASILFVMEFPIATWIAWQSKVMCNKLNLLFKAQELRIDDPVLLRPISYSWKLLRGAYLFKNLWLWYELVRADKNAFFYIIFVCLIEYTAEHMQVQPGQLVCAPLPGSPAVCLTGLVWFLQMLTEERSALG